MDIPDPLAVFLERLRTGGIPVGVRELGWLRHVFALQPVLDRQGLHDVLQCTLIKTPQQREWFEDQFAVWCLPELAEEAADVDAAPATDEPQDDETTSKIAPPPVMTQRPSKTPPHPQARTTVTAPLASPEPSRVGSWPHIALWGGLVVMLLLGVSMIIPGFWQRSPISMPDTSPGDWALLLLGSGIWLAAYGIWRDYRMRHAPPGAAPLDTGGPVWQPLPALPPHGVALLAPEAVRKMVWSIGRFVSEDLTPHLDIPRTVNATAHAGGIAVLHYQHAIHPREVWLWVDTATHDLTMQRLVWEVQYSLERAGLPCLRGHFRELPDPVTWEEGQRFSPLSLEGHRQGALVLVLTSGEDIALAHELAPERATLASLLHALADWPSLAFVDVRHGQYGLAGLLQGYGVRCITPAEVSEFLGTEGRDVVRRQHTELPLAGDLQAWAAGLALCPETVDENSAFALHDAMGLRLAPWALTVLLAQGEASEGGLHCSPRQRAAWLNWLVQAEGIAGAIPERSRLGKALDFWPQRYQEKERDSQEPPHRAAYRFAMERALLDLWRQPAPAAQALYRIYKADRDVLGAEIERRLARLVPRSDSRLQQVRRDDDILLPWHWRDLPAAARGMLYRMGIAGRWLTAGPLHMPGTVAWVLGVYVGVGTAVLVHGGLVGVSLLVGLGLLAIRLRRQHLAEDTTEPLEMVHLQGGTFRMGAAEEDEQAYSDERPQHDVTVSDFLLARYPVTRKQYRRVVRQQPAAWKWYEINPRLPAMYVHWLDAVRFCNDLSTQQGLRPCRSDKRLQNATASNHWT